MGGNGGQSFYRRDELSVAKAIRSEIGSVFRSVFFRGETAAALCTCSFFFRFVSLVTLTDKVR
jgi:hypothetical protein